ncbi:serine hydrolase domain-containing protein [Chitinophaga caeni]|uniref:serine hydrolase domain-containing protein n=1 Tax=Chitinophaga caeni TaxID=2029983 RepID=UPI001E3B5D44|nr:serine hydrolase domain-containing protein [Chitinophaga caeni]
MNRLHAAILMAISISVAGLQACGPSNAKQKTALMARVEVDTTYTINLSESDVKSLLASSETKRIQSELKDFFNHKLVRSGFSGTMLVARKGVVLFQGHHGYEDYPNRIPMEDSSSFQLASISKTFTGMGVLQLVEQQKISLEDSIQRFFPTFPYKGVTVRTLLNHRSGLPNYLYFSDSLWKDKQKLMTNLDVINVMTLHKPRIEHLPDTHFQYCNTNYVLLAAIIEKVSQQPFADYMASHIFKPLGLKHTYVYTPDQAARPHQTKSHYYNGKLVADDCFDGVMGDKGIYSTANDMLKWDQALYSGRFLQEETLKEAFTPYSHEKPGVKNYGLGFRMLVYPDQAKIIYHNGWWHGNNTVFYRFIKDSTTLVILGNKQNKNIYFAVKPVREILGEGIDDEAGED